MLYALDGIIFWYPLKCTVKVASICEDDLSRGQSEDIRTEPMPSPEEYSIFLSSTSTKKRNNL